MRYRHSLESIEVTTGNTATHPPNYFINVQQRKTTANSANLHYDPTLRLRSLNRMNGGLLLIVVTTRTIFSRYTNLSSSTKQRKKTPNFNSDSRESFLPFLGQ